VLKNCLEFHRIRIWKRKGAYQLEKGRECSCNPISSVLDESVPRIWPPYEPISKAGLILRRQSM